MSLTALLARARRPEYTGSNRCLPCTLVNVLLAGLLALALALVSPPLALAAVAVSLAAIALRGYLVPGTPALTRRYVPDWVLARFDKAPGPDGARVDAEADPAAVDPETYLRRTGLVTEAPDASDLVLDSAFEARWTDRMAAVRAEAGGADAAELAALVGVAPDRLEVERVGTSAVAAYVDDRFVGQWESRPALVADVAAARELDHRDPEWRDLPLATRSGLLAALRLFLPRCPDCGGDARLGDDVVTSCCRSRRVVAVTCVDCDARLLELDVDPTTLDGEGDAPVAAADPAG